VRERGRVACGSRSERRGWGATGRQTAAAAAGGAWVRVRARGTVRGRGWGFAEWAPVRPMHTRACGSGGGARCVDGGWRMVDGGWWMVHGAWMVDGAHLRGLCCSAVGRAVRRAGLCCRAAGRGSRRVTLCCWATAGRGVAGAHQGERAEAVRRGVEALRGRGHVGRGGARGGTACACANQRGRQGNRRVVRGYRACGVVVVVCVCAWWRAGRCWGGACVHANQSRSRR
jgi:hypothetical protein